MESFEVKKYYEWMSTSRQGMVEEYVAEDDTNVYFYSGRFVPKEEFESKLRQIDESLYLAKESKQSNFNAPPPAPAPTQFDEWEKLLGNDPAPNSIAPPAPKVEKEKSAIQIILEKQKKFVEVELEITIPFKFPSEKAIEFMSVMFDEDEVIEEICNHAISQLSNDDINSMIKEAIKERISSISKSSGE